MLVTITIHDDLETYKMCLACSIGWHSFLFMPSPPFNHIDINVLSCDLAFAHTDGAKNPPSTVRHDVKTHLS